MSYGISGVVAFAFAAVWAKADVAATSEPTMSQQAMRFNMFGLRFAPRHRRTWGT
jgi:hypothetical protein